LALFLLWKDGLLGLLTMSKIVKILAIVACSFILLVGIVATVVYQKIHSEVESFPLAEMTFGETIIGEKPDLAALAGKVVVIKYWGTRCMPCLAEMPHLVQMQKELKEKGLVVIAPEMATRDAPKIKKVADSKNLNFTVTNGAKAPPNLFFFPHTVVLDRQGRCVYSGTSKPDAEKIIREALSKS